MVRKMEKTKIDKMICYYLENNVSMVETSKLFDVSVGTISYHIKKNKIKVDIQRNKKGKKSWNSGLTKDTDKRVAKYAKTKSKEYFLDGYKMVWSDELNKSVREHHKIWFNNTGAWPDSSKNQQIHHIDGNRTNNDYENLVLCTVAEHTEIHKKYEQLVFQLIKYGIVRFDKSDNSLHIDNLSKFIELNKELNNEHTR